MPRRLSDHSLSCVHSGLLADNNFQEATATTKEPRAVLNWSRNRHHGQRALKHDQRLAHHHAWQLKELAVSCLLQTPEAGVRPKLIYLALLGSHAILS